MMVRNFCDFFDTGIWWYPWVASTVAKKFALLSMCLSNCPLLSVGQCGLLRALSSCRKSTTNLTLVGSDFGTKKALLIQSVGCGTGVKTFASMKCFISASAACRKFYGVSKGRVWWAGGIFLVSSMTSSTVVTDIRSLAVKLVVKLLLYLCTIFSFSLIHFLLGSLSLFCDWDDFSYTALFTVLYKLE